MNQIYEAIKTQGVLPLYFWPDAEISAQVLRTLYKSGIRVVEYTNRGQEALNNFKHLLSVKEQEMPDLILGIGTIKTVSDAQKYVDVGADFLISPCFSADIADFVLEKGLTWIPGCMTPTEINQAIQKGVGFIKLFPGNLLMPGFVSAIRDLFPDTLFMPTGGVEIDEINIKSWFNAGVCAVGMGSKLISKTLLENQDYEKIGALTTSALQIIRSLK